MSVYKKYKTMPGETLYRDGTAAKPDDYESFAGELSRLPSADRGFWETLLRLDPMVRLKINLSRIMGIMMAVNVLTVVPEGVTDQECDRLVGLSNLGTMSQVVGHELLNIRERQYFVDKFRIIFNAHKCKGGASNGQEESDRDTSRQG